MTRFRAEVEYFASKGHNIIVIFSSYNTAKSIKRNNLCFYNIRRIRYLQILYQVRLFFKCLTLYHSNPHVIFIVHEPISLAPLSLFRFLGLHPRTILVMHGPMAVETYLRGHKIIAAVFSIIDRIAFASADKIIAVSEYERNYAIKLKAPPQKVTIIRNGIAFPKLIGSSSFRQEMGIPPEKVAIGYIGSIAGYRGTDFLIKAFSIAKKITKKSLALVLVFREELTLDQIMHIKEMVGTDNGDVYISKPQKDVAPILSTLDIYASHFSKKIEGIGFSIMEAMSAGLPVITGRDAITNNLLTDGFDALLVEKENPQQIAEAIKKLAENQSLRKRIGNNAKKTATNKFSKEHMLALCEKEYLS